MLETKVEHSICTPERIYIDLNNPDPIVINSLDIALVKGDETLAESITGKTVCCLHIKEK